LLEDLDPDGSLPRYDVRIVEAWHDRRPALFRDLGGDGFPAFAIAVVEDDFGPLAPRPVDLHRRSI
jgi:hypothetical protein